MAVQRGLKNSSGKIVFSNSNINLEGLGDITVGSAAEVEIAFTGVTDTIRLKADSTNTGVIFIGKTGVLSDGSNDFVRLSAGDEITFDYNDSVNALYAISDTASQKINAGALIAE